MDQSLRCHSISHQSNGINRPGIVSSVMQQWEAISPNGKGVVIQTSNHSTKVVLASPFHHQDETTQQAVSIHVPMTVPNSPAHCQPFQQQQQQDTFQISSSSSELLSQNT